MRALLVAGLLLLTSGTAGAALPASSEEIVGSFAWYEYDAQQYCSSDDPLMSVVSTTLTSRLAHSESGGITTYTLHLEGSLADASCSAIDFEFQSAMAWPEPGSMGYGDFGSACGATGSLYIPPQPEGITVWLFLASAPAPCGLPFQGTTQLSMQIQPLSSGREVCTPLVLMGCSGVRQGEYYTGCPEVQDQFYVGVFGLGLVQAGHRCEYSANEPYGYAGDGFGIVTIRAEDGTCTLFVSDPIGGIVSESVDCPAELGAVVDGQDWSRVLP